MELHFYEFRQNNSGGKFKTNENLEKWVFIEAESPKQANKKLKSLGGYFDGCDKGLDCSCCGDRWSKVYDSDKIKFPLRYSKEIYFENIDEYVNYIVKEHGFGDGAFIYYTNGNKVKIEQK